MISPRLDFQVLKRAVSIERVLCARGWQPHRRGRGRLGGVCPVHGGDSPTAFVVDVERQLWFCFTGCKRGGDVVDLVRLMDHIGYREAAEELARFARFAPVPAKAAARPRGGPRPFRPFVRRLSLDPDASFLRDKGIRPDTAIRFDAGAWRHSGFLAGCVAVRLHDLDGHPLGYAGRRREPQAARAYGKWNFPRALPKRDLLFNYHRIAHVAAAGLVVVECPWGVMRLAQLGVPAVALLGTALTDTHRRCLRRSDLLVVLMDGDDAGRRAAKAICDKLRAEVTVVVRALPEGADPDDLDDDQLRVASSISL